jgi:nitroreductase
MDFIMKTKSLLPEFLKVKVRKFRFIKTCKNCYKYDAERFMKYSNAFYQYDNSEKLIGVIIAEYHVIEKGLTMPEPRLGFGVEIMKALIKHCNQYSTQVCNSDSEHFYHALSVIAEYKTFHDNNSFPLDINVSRSIEELLLKFMSTKSSMQISITKEEYFKHSYSSFIDFSSSRHSLRNYSGSVEIGQIEKAVKLAQNAPSACNRQPSRVYIIQNKNLLKQILAIQTGNRGFGHLADKFIILTAELGGYLSLRERNDVYINGGIYAMNLLYALHYYQIGACTLNWCSMPDQDIELRKICDIKPSENILLMIACGRVPDKFQLTVSHRNSYKNILAIR